MLIRNLIQRTLHKLLFLLTQIKRESVKEVKNQFQRFMKNHSLQEPSRFNLNVEIEKS